MPDNGLSSEKNTLPFGRREGPPRNKVVGGAVTEDEKAQIVASLDQARFSSESTGIRQVMLAFAISASVRDVVFDQIKHQAA